MAAPAAALADSPISRLLGRLDGVRQTAADCWMARCPAHQDRHPSLSIRELPDGRVLAHCWAGCHIGDVLAGVGLRLADLTWKASVTSSWCARDRLTSVEQRALRHRVDAARRARDAQRLRDQAAAAERAARLWAQARAADSRHPYLRRKGVASWGARQLGAQLVLPVTPPAGALVSLQFIAPDGGKVLLRGGRKRGCCIVVADPQNPARLLICEGWATGASLAGADPDARVLAAVDAGNLEPVARAAHERWPGLPIVMAGDNDASGVGQRHAHAAARAVGGLVLIPEHPGDWNDTLTGVAA